MKKDQKLIASPFTPKISIITDDGKRQRFYFNDQEIKELNQAIKKDKKFMSLIPNNEIIFNNTLNFKKEICLFYNIQYEGAEIRIDVSKSKEPYLIGMKLEKNENSKTHKK